MNMIRNSVIVVGLWASLAHALPQNIGCIGTDFDKVLSIPSKYAQGLKAMQILGITDTARGLWLYATSKEVRDTVNAAQATNLKDANGLPVIGTEGYIHYLFKQMPFVSEEKKKALIRVELIFKPNVPLIEYYQELQNQGIIIYVWTDNDQGGYERKLNALNAALKTLGKKPFTPDGFHCAKVGTKERGYSKVHPEYFRDAYAELRATHGTALCNKEVLFIDDKIENVQSAFTAQQEYGLNLDAVVYDSRKSQLHVVEEKVGIKSTTEVTTQR